MMEMFDTLVRLAMLIFSIAGLIPLLAALFLRIERMGTASKLATGLIAAGLLLVITNQICGPIFRHAGPLLLLAGIAISSWSRWGRRLFREVDHAIEDHLHDHRAIKRG